MVRLHQWDSMYPGHSIPGSFLPNLRWLAGKPQRHSRLHSVRAYDPDSIRAAPAPTAPESGTQFDRFAVGSRGNAGGNRPAVITGDRSFVIWSADRDSSHRVHGGPGLVCDNRSSGPLHRYTAKEHGTARAGGAIFWLSVLGVLGGASATGA